MGVRSYAPRGVKGARGLDIDRQFDGTTMDELTMRKPSRSRQYVKAAVGGGETEEVEGQYSPPEVIHIISDNWRRVSERHPKYEGLRSHLAHISHFIVVGLTGSRNRLR